MDMPTATTARVAAPHARNSTDMARAALLLLSALCVTLAGCASGTKHSTIPADGPTMSQIYRQHMAEVGLRGAPAEHGPKQQRGPDDPSNAGTYLRTAANEIDNRFARLPNPDLVMYVTPHLSANGRYPVPGYSTVFPMYETVEYAIPGEVPWRRTPQEPAAVAEAATATALRPQTVAPTGRAR